MSETTELHVPEQMKLEDAAPASEAQISEDGEKRQLSPRELAMERILARRQEAIAKEVAHGVELEQEARAIAGVEEDAPDDPVEAEPAPVEAKVEEPVAPAAPAAPAAPSLVDVDVPGYGRMQVTQEQLVRLAQMGAVANAAMHQAPAQVPVAPSAPVTSAPIIDDETAKAFARRLAYGDEAEGGKALQELITSVVQRAAAPQLDQTAIVQAAVQQSMQAQQFLHNMQTIGAEYPDIFGKPDETDPAALAKHHRLSRLAALELTDLRKHYAALGHARSDLDLYREAANNVRATLGAPQSQPAVEQATQSAIQAASSPSRLERKRAAPQNPTPVSRVASLGEQPRAPSGSQIVAAMRKARGQVPLH
ncbi:MAG TPA: hypothetical protein VFL96_00635 [Acidobacteriaceae bacterium]|nr:hypothetical protein [Acidobacteriaceae bacterium]